MAAVCCSACMVAQTARTVSLFAPMIRAASNAKQIKAASCCESAISPELIILIVGAPSSAPF
jgi:hypothetical protein